MRCITQQEQSQVTAEGSILIAKGALAPKSHCVRGARRPILQIPLSFGPVAVYANLSEAFHAAGYTLQLSAEVAAGIFQGAITTWDDKAILALNPNLTCAPRSPGSCPVSGTMPASVHGTRG